MFFWDFGSGASLPNPRARLHLGASLLMPAAGVQHLLFGLCWVAELVSISCVCHLRDLPDFRQLWRMYLA